MDKLILHKHKNKIIVSSVIVLVLLFMIGVSMFGYAYYQLIMNVKSETIEPESNISNQVMINTKIRDYTIEETFISKEYIGYCEEIGKIYNICPEFLVAIIETESAGQPNVENCGCKGLMQVSESVHRDRMARLGVTNLYNPYSNILVGTDLLSELFEKYKGNVAEVLMRYNGSIDAHQRSQSGNFTYYAEKILKRSEELERLHGK